MNDIYVILKEENSVLSAKGYYSFSRMCKENNIDKEKLNKRLLPIQIGNIKIFKVSIDTRI